MEAILGWHASLYLCIMLGCSRDVPHSRMGNKDSRNLEIKLKRYGALSIYEDAHALHICKYMKFWLGGHPRSAIRLCIRLSGSNSMGRKDPPTNVSKWMNVNCILLKTTLRPCMAWS